MAFFTIEDMYGTVEVLVFPKDYERYRMVIAEDKKVFVSGRVSSSEDENAKLICEKITEFNQMPSSLWIRFENKEAYEKAERELMDIIGQYDGKDKIVIYLTKENQKKIRKSYKIFCHKLRFDSC